MSTLAWGRTGVEVGWRALKRAWRGAIDHTLRRVRVGGEFIVRTYPIAELVSGKHAKLPDVETLTCLLMQAVDSDGWREVGGEGTIRYYEDTQSLIIRQQRWQHDELEDVIAALQVGRLSRPAFLEGRPIARTCLLGSNPTRKGPTEAERQVLQSLKTRSGLSFSTTDLQADINAVKESLGLKQVTAHTLNTSHGVIVVFVAGAD